jgi:hypothetical protein
VTVSTQAGVQLATGVEAVTFAADTRPMINQLSPSQGPAAGGTSVNITGSGFTGTSKVMFGPDAPAVSFVVVSDSRIVATSPAHDPGTYDVSVTTPSGTSTIGDADEFFFLYPTSAFRLSNFSNDGIVTASSASHVGYSGDEYFTVNTPTAGDLVDMTIFDSSTAFFTTTRTAPSAAGVLTPDVDGQTAVCNTGAGKTCTVEIGDTASENPDVELVDEASSGGSIDAGISFDSVQVAGCPQNTVDATTNCVSQAPVTSPSLVTVQFLQGGFEDEGYELVATVDNGATFTADQPDGSTQESAQQASCETNSAGECTFSVVDSSHESVDFNVSRSQDAGAPTPSADELLDFVSGSTLPARIDLLSAQMLAPSVQGTAAQSAEPGDAIQLKYQVSGGCAPTGGNVNCTGTPWANAPVTLSVDHGFFTPNCEQTQSDDPTQLVFNVYGKCVFSSAPVAGAEVGYLANLGMTKSVVTNSVGQFVVTIGIGFDFGFDDNGIVVAHVRAGSLPSEIPGQRTSPCSDSTADNVVAPTSASAGATDLGGCAADIQWTTREQPLNGDGAYLESEGNDYQPPGEPIPANNNVFADDFGTTNIPDVDRVDFVVRMYDQFDNLTSDAGGSLPSVRKSGPGSLYLCDGSDADLQCTGGTLAGSSVGQPDGTSVQQVQVAGSYYDASDEVLLQADTSDGSINLRGPCNSFDGPGDCQAANAATPGVRDGTQADVLTWNGPETSFSQEIAGLWLYSAGTWPPSTDAYTLNFYHQLAATVTFGEGPAKTVSISGDAVVSATVVDQFGSAIVDQTVAFSPSGPNASSCTPGDSSTTGSDGTAYFQVSCTAGGQLTLPMVITGADGTEYAAGVETINFTALPVITSITPSAGSTAGGSQVTINGAGFTGATKVAFGAATAGPPALFTVLSDTQIIATSPSEAVGGRNVFVTTPAGVSPTVPVDVFTYEPAPVVTAISPTSGPNKGGTQVIITGTGFTSATKVAFGAASFGPPATVLSETATRIVAISPPEAPGGRNVFVTTPVGVSAGVPADLFTYQVAKPTVTGISSSSGPTTGGTQVTITGTGFTGATKVAFGAASFGPAATFTVVSDTTITATAPAEAVGARNVFVTNPGGTSVAVPADMFTYVATAGKPTVTGISVSSGPTVGGTQVTITGTGFTGATKVAFGAASFGPAALFTVVSSTEIIATSPAESAGSRNIFVTTPAGTSVGVPADVYTYV